MSHWRSKIVVLCNKDYYIFINRNVFKTGMTLADMNDAGSRSVLNWVGFGLWKDFKPPNKLKNINLLTNLKIKKNNNYKIKTMNIPKTGTGETEKENENKTKREVMSIEKDYVLNIKLNECKSIYFSFARLFMEFNMSSIFY